MFLSPRGAHGSSFFNINWNIFISWIRRPSSTIVYGVEVFRYDKLSPNKCIWRHNAHPCCARPWVWQPSVDRTKLPLRPESPQSSVIQQNTPPTTQPSHQHPTLLFSVIFGDVLVGGEHSSSSLAGVFRQIRSQILISNGFFVSEYGMKNCTNIVLEILSCVCSWDKLVAGLAPDRGCRLINWKLCAKLQTNYI